ncbi:MAG TPA: hypothetical protein VFM04_03800 [Candidatus Methylomirabilis sp.]|nr:hypothetical protein [Candidatus Methylomirabilis sp.]
MIRVLSLIVLIGFLVFIVSPTPAAAGGGTLGMTPSRAWSMLLSDAELESIRGGFFGMAFSVFFQGFFDNLGNAAGTVNFSAVAPVNTGGTNGTSSPPAPVVSVANEQVRLFAGVGNLNGVSGILQINQVPGSNNFVLNQLFVQIAIINVQNAAQISNLSSLLRLR